MLFKYSLIASVVTLFGKLATADSETGACQATLGSPVNGFQATFFNYIYPDYAIEYSDEEYVTYGYNDEDHFITTLTGVTDVNFYHFYNLNQNGPTWGEINGLNITISNFTVEYSGWFTPIETGEYVFTIGQTDDATRIEIMEDSSYYCCSAATTNSTVIESYQIYDNTTIHEQSVYLQSEVSYPIKIVYFNKDKVAVQTVNFTDPSGIVHNSFEGYVQYFNDIVCDETPIQTSTSELPESSATISSDIKLSSSVLSTHSGLVSSSTMTSTSSPSSSLFSSPSIFSSSSSSTVSLPSQSCTDETCITSSVSDLKSEGFTKIITASALVTTVQETKSCPFEASSGTVISEMKTQSQPIATTVTSIKATTSIFTKYESCSSAEANSTDSSYSGTKTTVLSLSSSTGDNSDSNVLFSNTSTSSTIQEIRNSFMSQSTSTLLYSSTTMANNITTASVVQATTNGASSYTMNCFSLLTAGFLLVQFL
ncbi:similar to Saccharomyces cerevisiae YHR211W FLO5 Lectin-like cell wall protein (flocculin) involved in flocculation [Maudiozyma saulgeensis]|uniref:Similar to Saccharomyces cerevisiae YHR211W FLO5 Lectin-like cell wall protein (Flocculin) involved in flocculation n=1 Tax=Maudiozyma saulgeensis TaxID=1789683 RepID=A0A1X7R8C1_9SACH|nr:similar to Saccharomyces cerevisiae YHR211W FLO5 Lectin-like cell wall protein (flocculin) involved in flocculation [Kazachstania saulgeensis]